MKIKHKKILKITSISIAIAIALYLILNIAFNYWLQHNLPQLIKEKLPYTVSYKKLDVKLRSGDILMEDINIKNKTERGGQLGIEGHIDLLKISRFEIWEAIKHKSIHSKHVYFKNPKLKIRLPKPDTSSLVKHQPLFFENINLKNANIKIIEHNNQKLLEVEQLHLSITNLRLTEKDIKEKLPIVFDDYAIAGKNFRFHNNPYLITAENISSEDRQISIKNFRINPLIDKDSFIKNYPEKSKILDISTKELFFKNINLKESKLSLSEIKLVDPNIQITEIKKAKTPEKPVNISFPIELSRVEIINGSLISLDENHRYQISIPQVNAQIEAIKSSNENRKELLPFNYGKFNIDVKEFKWRPNSNLHISAKHLFLDHHNLSLTSTLIQSTHHSKVALAKIQNIKLTNYTLNLNKIKLEELAASGITGKLDAAVFYTKNKNKKTSSIKTNLDVNVGKIKIHSPKFLITNIGKNKSIELNSTTFQANNISFNQQSSQHIIPVKYTNFQLNTKNFKFKPNYYSVIEFSNLALNKHSLIIDHFSFLPTLSRKQFLASLPHQEDLYTVKIPSIHIKHYQLNLQKNKPQLSIEQLDVNRIFMNIYSYNGNNPPPDKKKRTFFNEKLRGLQLAFVVKNTNIKDATLEYEETDDQAISPGKITFSALNLNAKNLNSGKISPQNSMVNIHAKTLFFGQAPTEVFWNFDVNNNSDPFNFRANINNLNAAAINNFIKPYLHVSTEGQIENVNFNFEGNNKNINGPFNLKAEGLKVNILDKNSQEKKKFISSVANLFVPSKNKNITKNVEVKYIRTEQRSFFNLVWRGLEQGLQRSILGKKSPEKIEKAKQKIEKIKAETSDLKKEVRKITIGSKKKN